MERGLAENILRYVYSSVYDVLANDIGLVLPHNLSLDDDFLQEDENGLIFTVSEGEDMYGVYFSYQNGDIAIAYNLISTILPLQENLRTDEYEMYQERARDARKAISKYGMDNIKKAIRRSLGSEISIDNKTYHLSRVYLELEDAAYGSGFLLDLNSQSLLVNIEYSE